MTARPILFSAPMVRALLAGRKTQTRRIIKPQPPDIVTSAGVISRSGEGQTDEWSWLSGDPRDIDTWGFEGDFKTRFVPGDRLWVKETWRTLQKWDDLKPTLIMDDIDKIDYAADGFPRNPLWAWGNTRVSLFMQRWMSRITLTVTDVRVERLNDCSNEDAIAEGLQKVASNQPSELGPQWSFGGECSYWNPCEAYAGLWDQINGSGAWEANPWVVAVSFSVEHRNIDQ